MSWLPLTTDHWNTAHKRKRSKLSSSSGRETGWGGETEWGEAEVFGEAELMELAGELVGVTNEAELDRFLGDLINRAGQALRQAVRSPVGQAVGGLLKGAAKKALPLARAALGVYVGGSLGAQIGSGLASVSGSALGLEAEMMSAEDREFDGARKFVQMAGQAVKSAVTAPPTVNPAATAQSAVIAAAKKIARGSCARGSDCGEVGQDAGCGTAAT